MKYLIKEKLAPALTALKSHDDFKQTDDLATIETIGEISSVGARATYLGEIQVTMPIQLVEKSIVEAFGEEFYKAIDREAFGWHEAFGNYRRPERYFGIIPGDYRIEDGNFYFDGKLKIGKTSNVLIYSNGPMRGYSGEKGLIHLAMDDLYAMVFPLGFFTNQTSTQNFLKRSEEIIEAINDRFKLL